MEYTKEQIETWKRKAESWDALGEEISKCYGEINNEGDFVENTDSDFGEIGEIAANAFGWE